jgi:hypothetical protein
VDVASTDIWCREPHEKMFVLSIMMETPSLTLELEIDVNKLCLRPLITIIVPLSCFTQKSWGIQDTIKIGLVILKSCIILDATFYCTPNAHKSLGSFWGPS